MQGIRRFGLAAKRSYMVLVALAAVCGGSGWAQTTQLRPPTSALGTAAKPVGIGSNMHTLPPVAPAPQPPQDNSANTPSRESKIKEFNETAAKNAAVYASNKPTPSFTIPDEFKARYKYLKAWIEGDVLHVSTDAKMKLTVAQVLAPGAYQPKILAEINKDYYNAPVFSEKILLNELRSKMEGGTSGYYQFNLGTTDNLIASIIFDKNFVVQSPNAAPVVKGPKLVSIEIEYLTGNHDKEANNPVYVDVFSTPHDKIKNASGDYEPKTHVLQYSVQDPAKWDYGDKKSFDMKIMKPVYLSDFNEGGYFMVYGAKGDIWEFTAYIAFKFVDNTVKRIRWSTTFSGDNYPGFNFDKDFRMKEKFTK